ncbi:Uncharacterised protein [Streptococcus pyogenes]|nr:Uncharacterised protein [Streptococcus pyogenes]
MSLACSRADAQTGGDSHGLVGHSTRRRAGGDHRRFRRMGRGPAHTPLPDAHEARRRARRGAQDAQRDAAAEIASRELRDAPPGAH